MNKELVAHIVAHVKLELGNRAGADKCAASSSAGMLQVEQLVHESLMETGRQVVQDLATETDTGYLGPRLKRGKVVFRFKGNRPKTVHGRYGPVTVLHAYYASGSGELWVPLDEPWGIEFGQTAVGEYHLAQCAGQGPAPRSGPLVAPADTGSAGATSGSDQLDRIVSDLGTELGRLCQCPPAEQDFERLEGELHQRFVAAERATLAQELERLDVDRPEVSIEGRRHRRVLRATETYTSGVGPITVLRTLYRAGKEQPAVVPLELRAGIISGHWTPRAAHQASFLVAQVTPREGTEILDGLGNMSPSASSLERLPKQLSRRWEEHRAAFEEVLRADLLVPDEATIMAVSLDGVMAPMKDGKRQAKRAAARVEGRPTKGPAGYQEVGCGTVSFYDCDGERLGTLRMGRMPETKKATLKGMLSAEADGAHDNWSFLAELAPQAVSSEQLVDFYHAAEQLKAATDTAYGEHDAWGRTQYEKYRHVLRHGQGGVERVIRGLRYLGRKHPRRKRIKEVLGYFRRNRHRMDYAGAAARGLPIGSGVEAACKTLVTERMKRSGMRWREAGGQAILTLRGWVQSDRFDAAWSLLSGTYRTEVSVPDNEIELAHGRAA